MKVVRNVGFGSVKWLLLTALAMTCAGYSAMGQYDFIGSFSSSVAPLSPQVTAFQITGYVHDSDGNPIPGVGVGATLNGSTNHVYVDTGTNGTYTLSVTAGTWDVSVNCDTGSDSLENVGSGYPCCNDETVVISSASRVANFNIPDFGDSQLSGTILDGAGNPLTNITLYASDTNDYDYLTNLSATTDANGFYAFSLPNGTWDISVTCSNLNTLGFNCLNDQTNIGNGEGENVPNINFVAQSTNVPMPFFTGQVALGQNVYFLANATNTNNFYGYYSMQFFPYVYHFNLGFGYFIDANNGDHAAYIYDFTSGHFWYTSPSQLPYFFDFNLNSWLYCYPSTNSADSFQSNPRKFFNFSTTNTWLD